MSSLAPIALGVRSNKGRHGFDSAARLINAYAEEAGEEGKTPYPVNAINGLSSYATLTGASGGVRAMLDNGTVLLSVAGATLYSTTSAGVTSLVAAVQPTGLVTMARNRKSTTQTAIVADGQWYIHEGSTLTANPDADLPAPNSVCEHDGYFVFTISDGRWFISAVNEGTTVDALDFTRVADGLLRGATRGRDLCLFGPKLLTFYQDTGAADFPFERVTDLQVGCYAAGSVAELTAVINGQTVDSIAWAATDQNGAYNGVMLLSGYGTQKISTPQVDRAIRDETDATAIRAYAWSEDGHVFYGITGANFTWVYDTTTGLPHERKSSGLTRWRPSAYAYFDGKHLFGDYDDGLVYRSSPTAYDEAGTAIVMEIHTPLVHAFPHRLRLDALHVDVVPGVGLGSGGSHLTDPVMMLDYSDDGGANFGPQRSLALGAQGQTRTTLTARRLGVIPKQGRTFRLSCSAAVARCVMGITPQLETLAV